MKRKFIFTTLFSFGFFNYNFWSTEIISDKKDATQEVATTEVPVIEQTEVTTPTNTETEDTSSLKEEDKKAEFEFTKQNIFSTLWTDFAKEKSDLLHACNEVDNLQVYTIPDSYEKFNALDKFISNTVIVTLESLQDIDKNRITGVERKQKNTSSETWNNRINSSFKKFTEALDKNLFYVHFDQNDATSFNRSIDGNTMILKTHYTLKRVSPTKKFQLYSESRYNINNSTCSTPITQIRCIFGEKNPLPDPKLNKRTTKK